MRLAWRSVQHFPGVGTLAAAWRRTSKLPLYLWRGCTECMLFQQEISKSFKQTFKSWGKRMAFHRFLKVPSGNQDDHSVQFSGEYH